MRNRYDTIVIGAGQAGLAAGYYLQRAGVRFTLLDAADQVGAAWQGRWDSLRLFTPARYNSLPGMPFPGERYALPTKDEVARYLKAYAERFALPVRLRTRVRSLGGRAGRYEVTTTAGETLTAASIVVATGANQQPYVPAFSGALRPEIVQVHSSGYRRPSQLPEGRVLVVGAGNSGAQIALELAESGRQVVLSGPDTGSLPRRLLGRDIYDWLWPTLMRPRVDTAIGRRLMRGRLFAGDPLVGISAKSLARPGLERAGKTIGQRDGSPLLDGGRVLPDIAAIVWCTGFRPDFGWIELPLLGLDGYPRHRRGIAFDAPGVAFLGMRYQSRMGSALLGGVGEDAAYVVPRIARRSCLRADASPRAAAAAGKSNSASTSSASSETSMIPRIRRASAGGDVCTQTTRGRGSMAECRSASRNSNILDSSNRVEHTT
jgi:putative flavoprotein involved in K+ transport